MNESKNDIFTILNLFLRMLDKDMGIMVKYAGTEYRVDREEYPFCGASESPDHWLRVRAATIGRKCARERICLSDK